MSFELNILALEDQASLHLLHPSTEMPLYAKDKKGADDEAKPVEIVLKSSASQAYAKAVDAMMKKSAKRGNRAATPQESREQNVDFLVALSVEANNLTLDGEPVNNPDVFRKLYSDSRYDWIKTQINEFLAGNQNFLK